MPLTETWLNDCSAKTVVIKSAPPNFNYTNVSRVIMKGGGVAALFDDSFQCKHLSFGDFTSFEYLSLVLKGAPRILLAIVIRSTMLILLINLQT